MLGCFLNQSSEISGHPVVGELRVNYSLDIASCDGVSDVAIGEGVEDTETVARLGQRIGTFLQHRDRSSQSSTNNGAPGSNARVKVKSLIDGQIQCGDLIMKEERSDESGRGRRAEEIREKLALILERGFTANQIDDVPLPFVEVASRDID